MGFIAMVAALVSSMSWAVATILYCRLLNTISSVYLNLYRGIIVCVYLVIPIALMGWVSISLKDIVLLVISGILGIAVADTFYFLTLRHLGPRVTTLTACFVPVTTAVASFVFLGERLRPGGFFGILLTSFGVGWVLWERDKNKVCISINKLLGLQYAVLSITAMTIAIVLAKISISSTPVLQGAFLRMAGAVIALVLLIVIRENSVFTCWRQFVNLEIFKILCLMAFITTFGGFYLSLYALKHLPVAIASTLNSTAPLFILPMTVWFFKEKVSPRAVCGALIAVLGIAFILW